jgi:hypothetical protein
VRTNRPEKDGSDKLNIPKSLWAMKDKFCGNAARKREKKDAFLDKKIKPLYQMCRGALARITDREKIFYVFRLGRMISDILLP